MPKLPHRHLAYEWSNYRLAHQKINTYKGESEEVLDPFLVLDGWFTLNFANCFVRPNEDLPQEVTAAIDTTIRILRLNIDDSLVQHRFDVLRDYSNNLLPMGFLEQRYPFIATELKRQGRQDSIKGTIPDRLTGAAPAPVPNPPAEEN